eukprot:Lankesteria_metandrocarpae@DN5192_c0_g1_i2.p1
MKFVSAALAEGVRPDGREFFEYRPVEISFGANYGQVEVAIGESRAVCTVEGEIETPHEGRPGEGNLYFNVDFGFLAPLNLIGRGETNDVLKSARAKHLSVEDAVELSLIIEKLLIGSRALDKESLCITSGKEVWSLRCDVRAVDNDGNLRDVCALAALAGVLHFRRQEVRIENGITRVLSVADSDLVPLSVHHMPLLVTLAFFDHGEDFVVDPSAAEEEVMTGRLSVAANLQGDICGVHKPGGSAISIELLREAIRVAMQMATQLGGSLQTALDDEHKRRKLAAATNQPIP